jgi:hypothetical protein
LRTSRSTINEGYQTLLIRAEKNEEYRKQKSAACRVERARRDKKRRQTSDRTTYDYGQKATQAGRKER